MKILALFLGLIAAPAFAEYARYGEVDLNGLSRNGSWQQYEPGYLSSMVCNVNGPDGFLSVRSGPGTNYAIRRNLKRLAIVTVDTRYRQGSWVYVRTAYRAHDESGYQLRGHRNLHVEGWAHSGHLCDFTF